jgi:NTE family protein
MTRIGLALGGGGSKGAFQMGAWQAFREMNLEFAAIAGASIGAINGAFLACGDFDGALEMWQGLQMDQCLEFSENRQVSSLDLISMKNARVLAREMLTQHQLNTRPLREMLGHYIQEERVRGSRIEYGLLTALYPNFSPMPRWIWEIPENQLLDHIMASARLPGLQSVRIDGHSTVDGGLVERVPISMLKHRGFRRIVAVDLGRHAVVRSPLLDNVQLTFIHDRQDLGGTFDITPEVLQRNRRLGYLDTLKAFDRLGGEYYAFEPSEWRQLLQRYGSDPVRGLEQAAIAYGLAREPIYTAEDFVRQIQLRRREVQQEYEARRKSLKIDHKFKAILNGRLTMLNLLPHLRLAFLLELTAHAQQSGSLLHIPMHLFHNLDLAAQALCLLESQ